MSIFNHGLTDQELAILKGILYKLKDKIDRVAVFGSRATGKYRNNSDIDLVIYGNSITQSDINALAREFDDSSLAYPVDICAYHLIKYQPFKEHIDQVNQTLFA
ncbi:nucleotidyltransferase domain-containing protein [Thiotrichales bacterium 19S9-12]|nr:nucleotidyltransferase domain-containing protein [Thiotrichales bacterium 19S9-11]MCF6812188.1 nucleotidyltransferase domain-containing protein [Thiotrichales bacterium 19S9-12]